MFETFCNIKSVFYKKNKNTIQRKEELSY